MCLSSDDTNQVSDDGNERKAASVYQVRTGNDPICYRLGTVSEKWSYEFVDHRRPGSGITLTYYTGDSCVKRITKYDKDKGTRVEWMAEERIVKLNIRYDF